MLPERFDCVVCNSPGSGCRACDYTGEFECTDDDGRNVCPAEYVEEVMGVMELVRWAERGVFPLSGGVMEQAAAFLDLVRTFETEKARLERLRQEARRAR